MKKCIICGGTPFNKRSNLCSECFAELLKEKIEKEDEEGEDKACYMEK